MLHARPGIFVIPNPWDAGSAKILALLGFEALATTSAGFAFSVGKPDAEGALNRPDTLANARTIVDATSLPVSAGIRNDLATIPKRAPRRFGWRPRQSRRRVDQKTPPDAEDQFIRSRCQSKRRGCARRAPTLSVHCDRAGRT
jgi:hypothetical protein